MATTQLMNSGEVALSSFLTVRSAYSFFRQCFPSASHSHSVLTSLTLCSFCSSLSAPVITLCAPLPQAVLLLLSALALTHCAHSSQSASGRTDCALAAYNWNGYEACATHGYDDLAARIPELISTLQTSPTITGTSITTPAANSPAVPAPVTCATRFGNATTRGVPLFTKLGNESVEFSRPSDVAWNPDVAPNGEMELWVTNKGADNFAVMTFASTGELVSSEYRADRAPYHYMASVSSLAFSGDDVS